MTPHALTAAPAPTLLLQASRPHNIPAIYTNNTSNTIQWKGQKLIKKYQKLNCYHHFDLIDDIYKIIYSDDPRNIRSCNALIKRFNKMKRTDMQMNIDATRIEQDEYFQKFNATYRPNFELPFSFSDDDDE